VRKGLQIVYLLFYEIIVYVVICTKLNALLNLFFPVTKFIEHVAF